MAKTGEIEKRRRVVGAKLTQAQKWVVATRLFTAQVAPEMDTNDEDVRV